MTEVGIVYTLATNMGVAGVILLIWYLTHKADKEKWKIQHTDEMRERAEERKLRETLAEKESAERSAQATKEIAERSAHAKDYQLRWDSREQQFKDLYDRMLESHKQETDRAYNLLEREVQVSELHASLLQSISGEVENTRTELAGKIQTNQFCPGQRKPEKIGD